MVDEEAPSITTTVQWNADFPNWLKAYRDAAHVPFDAVVFDLDWRQPWQTTPDTLTSVLTWYRNR